MQSAQRRSELAVPAFDIPSPTGQIDHETHAPFPACALNWPAPHASQTRLLDAVGGLLRYSPIAHGAATAVHTAPLTAGENVTPSVHAEHTRSVAGEPACACPWPTGQVLQAEQISLPGVALNQPAKHGAQARSDDVVGEASMK